MRGPLIPGIKSTLAQQKAVMAMGYCFTLVLLASLDLALVGLILPI